MLSTSTRVAGTRLRDLPRRLDAVQQRHRDVEDRDVGLVLLGQAHRLAAVARLGDDLPVGPLLEHLAQPLADDGVIVGEEDAKRRHRQPACRVRFVGTPIRHGRAAAAYRDAACRLRARFSMANVPPSACARSRMPMSPRPRRALGGSRRGVEPAAVVFDRRAAGRRAPRSARPCRRSRRCAARRCSAPPARCGRRRPRSRRGSRSSMRLGELGADAGALREAAQVRASASSGRPKSSSIDGCSSCDRSRTPLQRRLGDRAAPPRAPP